MLPRFLLAALIGWLIVPSSEANAFEYFVVDTGPGRANAMGGDPIVTDGQFQAGQFWLEADATIVRIEGWLTYLTILGQLPVRVVVYGDNGDVPDDTDVYWTQQFSVDGALGLPGGWWGVEGITLELDAGTYWVSFELPSAAFGTAAMPPTPVQELDNYATGGGLGWNGDDSLNLGLRVAVPEPGSLAQLAAGMVGLLGLSHRPNGRRRSPFPIANV